MPKSANETRELVRERNHEFSRELHLIRQGRIAQAHATPERTQENAEISREKGSALPGRFQPMGCQARPRDGVVNQILYCEISADANPRQQSPSKI
jgi:hypothetical protein